MCSVYLTNSLEQYVWIPLTCNHWNHKTPQERIHFCPLLLFCGREFLNGFRSHMTGTELVSSLHHFYDNVTWHFSVAGFGCPGQDASQMYLISVTLCCMSQRKLFNQGNVALLLSELSTIFLFVSFLEPSRWHHCIAAGSERSCSWVY